MQTIHFICEAPATYTYCDVTSSIFLWNAVGLRVQKVYPENGTVKFPVKDCGPVHGPGGGATEAEIIEARITSGSTGDAALIWLIAERRRQHEELEKNSAIKRQAAALEKSGDAAVQAARIHKQAEELRLLKPFGF